MNQLLKVGDDFVVVLSIPQDLDSLSSQIAMTRSIFAAFQQLLALCGLATSNESEDEVLARLTGRMNLQSGMETVGTEKDRKWFDTCFVHLFKLCDSLSISIGKV